MNNRGKWRIGMAIILPLILNCSGNASASTSSLLGTPCTKLGQKVVSAGKKLSCAAKGKKLVWVISPVVQSSPTLSIVPKFTTIMTDDVLTLTVFGVNESLTSKNHLRSFFVEFSLDKKSLDTRAVKGVYGADGSPLKSWIFEATGLSVAGGHILGVVAGFINEAGQESHTPESYITIVTVTATPTPTQLSCAYEKVAPPPCEPPNRSKTTGPAVGRTLVPLHFTHFKV